MKSNVIFPFTLLFLCATLPNSLDKDYFHIFELIPFKSASKHYFYQYWYICMINSKKLYVAYCANSSLTAVFL